MYTNTLVTTGASVTGGGGTSCTGRDVTQGGDQPVQLEGYRVEMEEPGQGQGHLPGAGLVGLPSGRAVFSTWKETRERSPSSGAGLLGLPPAEATPVPPASPLGTHQGRATRIASNALLLTSPVPRDYGNPAARVERYSGNRTVASCILTSRSRVRGPQAVGILTVTGGG